MGLEDFEREIANARNNSKQEKSSSGASRKRERERSRSRDRDRDPSRKRHHRSHHHSKHDERKHHKSSKHRHRRDASNDEDEKGSRHKRRRHQSRDEEPAQKKDAEEQDADNSDSDEWIEKEAVTAPVTEDTLDEAIADAEKKTKPPAQRDSWMQAPSALDIEYVNSKRRKEPPPHHVSAAPGDMKMMLHRNEINYKLKEQQEDEEEDEEEGNDDGDDDDERPSVNEHGQEAESLRPPHTVSYTFGDAGSSWRMTKLKNVYRSAKETGKSVEEVAMKQYGDLRSFDDAREEEVELDRRKTYGKGYVGKDKPSGELFQDRKMAMGDNGHGGGGESDSEDEFEAAQTQGRPMEEKESTFQTVPLDQTALNKLKAQMMKAKLRRDPEAAKLEAEYSEAMAAAANRKQPDVVVLNKMENRMLAGGRQGEVRQIENKRGRERGLVEENQDMSIEDMVRQEKRSRGQFNEGRNFAERIAKDSKFDDNLDYMDENASRLAKAAPKSDINLRNTAIESYQKTAKILESCPLCYHEDTNTPPVATIVSLATRVYMTLPTAPEITPYGLGATIVPIQHHRNLLDCDDDEWEEIRNFMKSLSRFYFSQKPSRAVIFYENAIQEGLKRHASLEAVPLPVNLGETAPAFFREAILAADDEWTQHKKLINTLSKATDGGLGKLAFRKSMVSELPYFHVWFSLDGGFGHVVEDARRWPRGDLFAREVIGGMLDVPANVVKKQGRWRKGDQDMAKRIKKFKDGNWEKWDWTKVLMDAAQ